MFCYRKLKSAKSFLTISVKVGSILGRLRSSKCIKRGFTFFRQIRHRFYQQNSEILTMVFCYQNCSSDQDFFLKFEAESQEFEITKTTYSNSERSELFLVTECFFNLFLEVSHIYTTIGIVRCTLGVGIVSITTKPYIPHKSLLQ